MNYEGKQKGLRGFMRKFSILSYDMHYSSILRCDMDWHKIPIGLTLRIAAFVLMISVASSGWCCPGRAA